MKRTLFFQILAEAVMHQRISLMTVIVTVCFIAQPQAGAQFIQQGIKFVGTGAVGNAYQGYSVSLSADGNTAIVGGPTDNSEVGAAWVFTFSGGLLRQQGSKLVGSGAVGSSWQGNSVSLSSDGNTAIVGGPFDNSGVGAAWVFTRSGGVWSQQGDKLVGTGAVGSAYQGTSVSLSADGNTAIVGGYLDSSVAGAAWVFTRSGGVWSQQGSKLVGSGAVCPSWQGSSVSLSSDGNTAIVGGTDDNSNIGAVWVFTRSGGVWSQQGDKLVGTGAVGIAFQGSSVSLSSDGNTAIIGGFSDNGNRGAVWVFTRSGGVWSQQGDKLVGNGAVGATQGNSVSVSADGNTAIVGGPSDNGSKGAMWEFARTGGAWSQQGTKSVGTGAVGSAYQGNSVSLSADGNTAIVGGPGDNSGVGAAWIWMYERPTITSIQDIPGDQGGKVRIKWNRIPCDTAYDPVKITSYGLWRRITSGMSLGKSAVIKRPFEVTNDTLGTLYDFITNVPAVQSPGYNVVAQTLTDSTSIGNYMYTYLVTAHTSDPNVFWISQPDSGYSVDNLPPFPVIALAAQPEAGPSVNVHWSKDITDPDVGYYEIHRSTTNGFSVGPLTKIGQTSDTTVVDNSPVSGAMNYYRVITVDIHGNKSIPSQQASAGVAVTTQIAVSDRWNLISVPLTVSSYSKSALYPTAVSDAFAYQGSYVIRATLANGVGYWLKFNGGQSVGITGLVRMRDSISVQAGWNIIGSISSPVAVAGIGSSPGGIVASQFFGYSFGYHVTDTIQPGKGYWVKVYQSGKLILASAGELAPETRIRIVPDGENPPAPPGEEVSNLASETPNQFALQQNYPNPFNPSTVINYELPKAVYVRLVVYDMLGREVATLVNGAQDAGYRSVEFSAANLPSGIYTYRLTAGTFVEVKKMLMIK